MLLLSEDETRIFGLKTGRSERLDALDGNLLLQSIVSNEFDLCRIKVNASYKDVFEQLNNTGIPYSLYNILSQSGKKTSESDLLQLPENVSYEIYDGSQKQHLFEIIEDSMLNETAANFQNSFIEVALPMGKRILAAQNYAHGFTHFQSSHKVAWLLKYNGEYAGFGLLLVDKTFSDLVFHGVKKKFRGKRLGREIKKIALDFCFRNNSEYMGGDIAIQNINSLKSVMGVGGDQRSAYLNFILTPFFSYSIMPVRELEFTPQKYPEAELMNMLFSNSDLLVNGKFLSIKAKTIGKFSVGKKYILKISVPVAGEKKLILVKVLEGGKNLICFLYLETSG